MALSALLLAGCGGGGSSVDAGDSSDAEESDAEESDAEVPDAEVPDAEESDAAAPDAAGMLIGTILVSETGGGDSNMDAVFKDTPLFGVPSETAGGCSRYDTDVVVNGVSAGVITVTGAAVAVSLTPSGTAPDVFYTVTPDPLPMDLYTPGATITATAPGDDFPAFSIAAVAPSPLTGATLPSTFSRSAPPNITWAAGTADTVLVQLVTFDSGFTMFSFLLCFTDDDGAFGIPAAAMALIPTAHTQAGTALVRMNQTIVNPTPSTQLELWVATAETGALGPITP